LQDHSNGQAELIIDIVCSFQFSLVAMMQISLNIALLLSPTLPVVRHLGHWILWYDQNLSLIYAKTDFGSASASSLCGDTSHLSYFGDLCRPQEIDEAARRRFVKRLYVPLPEGEARKQIVRLLMARQANSLTNDQFTAICDQTEGVIISVLLFW